MKLIPMYTPRNIKRNLIAWYMINKNMYYYAPVVYIFYCLYLLSSFCYGKFSKSFNNKHLFDIDQCILFAFLLTWVDNIVDFKFLFNDTKLNVLCQNLQRKKMGNWTIRRITIWFFNFLTVIKEIQQNDIN